MYKITLTWFFLPSNVPSRHVHIIVHLWKMSLVKIVNLQVRTEGN